jgi:hypothetical protein
MGSVGRLTVTYLNVLFGYLLIASLLPIAFGDKTAGHARASSERSTVLLPPNIVGIVNGKDCAPKLPRHALRFEITGKTRIGYKYNERGIILSAWIIKSAGELEAHKLLDDAAITAVMSCKIGVVNPMPHPSPGTKGFLIRPLQMRSGEGSIEFAFDIDGVTSPSADFTLVHRFTLPEIQASLWRPISQLTSPNRLLIYLEFEKVSVTSVRFWLLTSSDVEKFEPSSSI